MYEPKIIDVTRDEMRYGMADKQRLKEIVPLREDIPKEFFKANNEWHVIVDKWFYESLGDKDIRFLILRKEFGTDQWSVYCMLRACLQSCWIDHHHRIAAVAYMMSKFFDMKR